MSFIGRSGSSARLLSRGASRGVLALGLVGIISASACHGSDSGSEVSPAGGSGGSGGTGGSLQLGNGNGTGADDAGAGGQSGAMSTGPGQCAELAGLGKCGTTTVQAAHDPASILLVIDKSGSMTDQPDGFTVDKWDALKSALGTALDNTAAEINYGLELFPYSTTKEIPLECDTGCCDVDDGVGGVNVPIQAGQSGVDQIKAALTATSPGGGTPTAAALKAALTYFSDPTNKLDGKKFVLLATDGGPNCNANNTCDAKTCTPNLDGQCPSGNCCSLDGTYCLDDSDVVTEIQALAHIGVSTFVVGIPGTEQYATYLDAFAKAGGATNPSAPPSYYAVSAKNGVQGLVDVFTSITTHLVRDCDVALDSTPTNLDLVNVAVDCKVIPYADGAGWSVTGSDMKTLSLMGDACHAIQTSGAERVDVVYGCPTVR